MSIFRIVVLIGFALAAQTHVIAEQPGSRLTYLDENDPYYPHPSFPRLTTPMWVGEDGVDAVILLSIDDMGRVAGNSFAKPPVEFERYLAPIVERLQKIDGRSPVTIFTCNAQPDDPCLRRMLDRGLSLECHSYQHRFPFFRTNKGHTADEALRFAQEDFVLCMESLFRVPGNRPVAWRLPGCDAQNSNSPRFYAEVFPLLTSGGNFLSCDSSITTWFPLDKPSDAAELRRDADGRRRFEKYPHGIPQTKRFVNQIVDYPFPYVINHRIWEIPVTIPCDSHGVHQHGKQSDKTVDDWKRAVDVCVQKQGLMNILFHSIDYIRNTQIRDVVEYADRTYGKRVKFLNCREIYERLTRNVLGGETLRSKSGGDNGVRVLDLDADGSLDVVIGNDSRRETRRWNAKHKQWDVSSFPVTIVTTSDAETTNDAGVRFFTSPNGYASFAVANHTVRGVWRFNGSDWQRDKEMPLPDTLDGEAFRTVAHGVDRGVRFRDLNGDGAADMIVNNHSQNAVFLQDLRNKQWRHPAFELPGKGILVDAIGRDRGLRFADLDDDGDDDVILSNERQTWVRLFEGPKRGWSKLVSRAETGATVPPIVRDNRINGVWFRKDALILQNEHTIKNRDYITRIPFADLIGKSKE
ncbi:MAG: hypothetical protein CMJ78_21125 [Planctomycetaceae bacterium]|nr:hypothetical protein [Planctomycetaceae bacterium]